MKPEAAIKKIVHIADEGSGSLEAFLYLSSLAEKDKITIPKPSDKGCSYNSWDDTYEVYVAAKCASCSNEIMRFTLSDTKEDGFIITPSMPKDPLFCPFCGQAIDITAFKRKLTKQSYIRQKQKYIKKINKRLNNAEG